MEFETAVIEPDEETPWESQNDASDLLPEYCHYQDEGCEFAPSCLECPFARCVYDEPGGKQHFVKELRNQEILRLYTTGKEIRELAEIFGISQRTVHRALKRARNE